MNDFQDGGSPLSRAAVNTFDVRSLLRLRGRLQVSVACGVQINSMAVHEAGNFLFLYDVKDKKLCCRKEAA